MTNSDFNVLREIYDEIDKLIADKVICDSPEFKAWHHKTERFLAKKYGDSSQEYKNFKNTDFSVYPTAFTRPEEYIDACKKDLQTTKLIFDNYLKEIIEEEKREEIIEDTLEKNFSELFVVYGHDGELKEKLARLMERQNITPIILSELVKQGETIIELLEEYSNVPAAVCLFTADDLGREKNDENERRRARQNVVFETGLLMGKLGRKNLIIIADSDIELPSDLNGVYYIKRDEWKVELLKEMNAIGYRVDADKLL